MKDKNMAQLFQFVRFGFVGVAATVVHVVVVITLVETGAVPNPLIANIFAFSSAVIVSYVGHSFWTFQGVKRSIGQFARFSFLTLFAFSLNQGILYACTRVLGWDYKIGVLLAVVFVPIITFILARSWVFRSYRP